MSAKRPRVEQTEDFQELLQQVLFSYTEAI